MLVDAADRGRDLRSHEAPSSRPAPQQRADEQVALAKAPAVGGLAPPELHALELFEALAVRSASLLDSRPTWNTPRAARAACSICSCLSTAGLGDGLPEARRVRETRRGGQAAVELNSMAMVGFVACEHPAPISTHREDVTDGADALEVGESETCHRRQRWTDGAWWSSYLEHAPKRSLVLTGIRIRGNSAKFTGEKRRW